MGCVLMVKRKIEKEEAERERLAAMWERERRLWADGYTCIAGIDEAGRGPLAGPVVAACVILPSDIYLPGLNDSKKVAPHVRTLLAEQIKSKAVDWSVGIVEHREIDEINILQATKKAMAESVAGLNKRPDYLLIDALEIALPIPQEGIIHGDSLSASIAAASILAKTYRDSLMEIMDELYPEYGFKEHKGYGTPRHIRALQQFGPCPVHRKSFLTKFKEKYDGYN